MTGTAKTEEEEFNGIYKLDVVQIPTNRPMIREDENDAVFITQKAQVSGCGRTRSKSATPPASRCWWARFPWKRAKCWGACWKCAAFRMWC